MKNPFRGLFKGQEPEDPSLPPARWRPYDRICGFRQNGSIPDWRCGKFAASAKPLLQFLATRDPFFKEDLINRQLCRTIFAIREAQDRDDLESIDARVTSTFRKSLRAEIEKLARSDRRRFFRPVDRVGVLIVLVDVPDDPDEHRLTVVVTVESRDFVVDMEKDQLIHGDPDEIVTSQEFWTFRRKESRWQVERVRSAEDADTVFSMMSQISAKLYSEFSKVAERSLLKEIAAYPA